MPKTAVTQKPKISDKEAAICERMRSRRVDLGIPQKELAKRMGVSLDTLRSYEYARAPVRYGFANRFCDELDVNQRWLFSGSLPMRPYFSVSPIWAQFIPAEMHFSKVAEGLLAFLIAEALAEMIERENRECSFEEMEGWDHFPWVPQLGTTMSGTRDDALQLMESSLAHTINRIPDELWAALVHEHSKFLKDFEKRHRGIITDYLAENPLALLIDDEDKARSIVAARLRLDPAKLSRISMIPRQRHRPR
ncbi:MAG: helix-turn-helix domain-containing protein [Terrimicrobiaceae bacterium]